MISLLFRITTIVAVLVSLVAAEVAASKDIRVEKVHFKKGTSSAVLKGSIKGYEIVDYVLGAKQGQYMSVSMVTDNNANYFNILAPGENQVAFFNGSTSDNQYAGILPRNGEYKIRVYLMRSAARRNEGTNYNLKIIITKANVTKEPSQAVPSSNDALVQGTNYHATGNIPYSVAKGQPSGSCPFGVTR